MRLFILIFLLGIVGLGCTPVAMPPHFSDETKSTEDSAVGQNTAQEMNNQKAEVTLDMLTCTPLPPPAHCPTCHFAKLEWSGSVRGPVGTAISSDTTLGYEYDPAECGQWTQNIRTNCLRKAGQPSATSFVGGMPSIEVPDGYEISLVIHVTGPEFNPFDSEVKTVICH